MSIYLLLLLFVVTDLDAACDKDSLNVQFIANASIKISDGETTLLTDFPYQSGYAGYMEYEFEKVNTQGYVLSIVTHRHADHFKAELFQNTDWTLLAPDDVIINSDSVRRIAMKDTVKFRGISIFPFETPHADVEHYSYLVEWKGKTLYFTGDTENLASLKHAHGVDLLFISPWLYNQLENSTIKLDIGKIIIYHHQENEDVRCKMCIVPKRGALISVK